MVAVGAERRTDTKGHLFAQHKDPLLGPVLGNEPRPQHLVDPVDRAHRDRTDDAPSPVGASAPDGLVQSLHRSVAEEDGQDQELPSLETVRVQVMDLGQ